MTTDTTTTAPASTTTTIYVLPCYNSAQVKVPGCDYTRGTMPVPTVPTTVATPPAAAVVGDPPQLAYTGSMVLPAIWMAAVLIAFGAAIRFMIHIRRHGRRVR